jgi:acetylglutamate kinase
MINKPKNRDIVVGALKHAAPYIRMYKKKIFVIKAGGEVFESRESTNKLVEQVSILHQLGIRIVVVHGGGPQSTRLAGALGIETNMIDGRRVTSAETLKVSAMILNGEINTQILAACRDLDVPAVGISGVDCGLINASKRPPVQMGDETVDYGFVGNIESVDVSVLHTQLDNGLVPIISPLSADSDGTLLNINADTVAAELASALNAEKLILATGAPGILEDAEDVSSIISYLDIEGLQKLRDNGSLKAGMLPKAIAIETAIHGGVSRVHMISYKIADSLLLEVFTNEGTGTLIVKHITALSAAEQGQD